MIDIIYKGSYVNNTFYLFSLIFFNTYPKLIIIGKEKRHTKTCDSRKSFYTQYPNARGVYSQSKSNNNTYEICRNTNTGVMNNKILYFHKKKKYLLFSKPCVCGSLDHVTTRHHECIFNKKYDDASEH